MVPSGHSVRGVIDSDFVRYTGRSGYGELAGKPNDLAGHWLPKIAAISTTIPFETPLATTDWISSSPLGVGNPVLVFCKPYQIHRENKPEVLSDGDSVTVIAECLEVEASWFRQHVSEALELDSAKLREAVQALLDTDAARVVGMGSATGLVGQKLQSSGTQERTYPSEYDPPEIPSPQDLEDGLGWPPGSFPAPTAFMTRNVGFDVLATVDDFVSDRGQQLTVSCYRALDGGDVVTSELITPTGKVPMTTMPIFISASVDTTVYLHRGETILLGAMTPRAKDFEPILNKRWLMFLRLAK